MDFNNKLADVCGVSIQTVYSWHRKKHFPKYSQIIKSHIWNGEIFYKGWEDFRFNGKYICNDRTGQYISNTQINSLWVLKQKLQYEYEQLTRSKNLDFDLELHKVLEKMEVKEK